MNDLTLYESHRPKMHSCDLIQWASNTILGWIIRWWSQARDNHTGAVLRVNQQERVYTTEALAFGFAINPLSDRLANHRGVAWWHPLKPEFEPLRADFERELGKLVGTKYDYKGLVHNLLGLVFADARSVFCSEAIYLAGVEAGLPVPGSWPAGYAPRPGDMLELGWFVEDGARLV